MRVPTTTSRGPRSRAVRRPPGRLDSHNPWTNRRGPVTWPNGVVQTRDYDETGTNATLTDAANGRTWLADQTSSSPQGQILTNDYAGGSNYGGHRAYTYDADGRLTTTNDTLSATGPPACTTRTYGFDADSN